MWWQGLRKDTPEVDAPGELLLIDDPAAISVDGYQGSWEIEGTTALPWYRDGGGLSLFSPSAPTKYKLKSLELQMPLLIDLMRMAEADPSITGCTFHYAKGFP